MAVGAKSSVQFTALSPDVVLSLHKSNFALSASIALTGDPLTDFTYTFIGRLTLPSIHQRRPLCPRHQRAVTT